MSNQKFMFQVVWQEPHTGLSGSLVWQNHETRVFADDEVDAECKVADRHPDGFGFWAINCKDLDEFLDNNPNAPFQRVWRGSY